MTLLKTALIPAFIGGFIAATPASAAPLLFTLTGQTLTGPTSASFVLDSNPVPTRINNQPIIASGQTFFDNVPGVFNGVTQTGNISFGFGSISNFQFQSASGSAQFGGPQIFTGTISAPVFSPGTFRFTGFSNGTLTISQVAAAVPEPASWAMMIGGFGLLGGTMRYRRRSATVAFA